MKSRLVLSGCLLFTCLLSPVYADNIVVLDLDFETDPPNFEITTQQDGDATASFEFGNVGPSRGLIFKGTFLTKENVDVFEYATGRFRPLVPTYADYHLYPSETDGIYRISASIDAIVDGLPSDNEHSLGQMGIIFQLWQPKNGSWKIYSVDQLISNKTWATIGWTDLTAEDFKRTDGTMPDFSATAEPIVFAISVGIGYKWISGSGAFVSTSTRLDNWKVEAKVGLSLFKDGFEE